MSTNPFEPPRTSDLEVGAGPGTLVFSEAALQELSASATWVRWFARLMAVSMAVGILEGFVNWFGSRGTADSVGFFSLVIGTAVSIAFLAVLRRYAVAAERLREGTRKAAVDVVIAQSSYFKLMGAFTIIGIVLGVLMLVIGIAIGTSRT